MTLDEEIDKIQQEVSHSEEKDLLLGNLSAYTLTLFKTHNAFIAGGAITSVFSNKPIKDIDVFFRTAVDFERVERVFIDRSSKCYAKTSNATTFQNFDNCKVTIQLIKLPTTIKPNPVDLFNEFDFTCCCGLFDFETMNFKFHRDFLKHVSQRKIVFNAAHRYPISSLLRTGKYKDKGYTIDQENLLKIIISIGSLNLKTNKEAAEQFQGMYLGDKRPAFESFLKDETPFEMGKFLNAIKGVCFKPEFGDIKKANQVGTGLYTAPPTVVPYTHSVPVTEELPF